MDLVSTRFADSLQASTLPLTPPPPSQDGELQLVSDSGPAGEGRELGHTPSAALQRV